MLRQAKLCNVMKLLRLRGATVARLTPDQKVACSNHVGVIAVFGQCYFSFLIQHLSKARNCQQNIFNRLDFKRKPSGTPSSMLLVEPVIDVCLSKYWHEKDCFLHKFCKKNPPMTAFLLIYLPKITLGVILY
jgi:hypothetical protein